MRVLALLAVALLVAVPAAALPRGESHRYVAGAENFYASVGLINAGGLSLVPQTGETRVTVDVVDDQAGPGIGVLVCQDLDGDDRCDRRAAGCSPQTLTGIDATKEVSVFVQGASGFVVGCTEMPATRGWIHATFE